MSAERKRPSMKELSAAKKAAEERKAQERQKVTRRNFLAGLFASGLAVAGGVLMTRRESQESQSAEAQPLLPTVEGLKKEYTEQEAKVERILERVRQGLQRLETRTAAHREQYPPEFQEMLQAPFAIRQANEQNPAQNRYTVLRNDLEQRGEAALTTSQIAPTTDLRFFSYGLTESDRTPQGFIATFEGFSRTLRVSEHLEEESVVDDLVIYHELVHAIQDSYIRSTAQSAEDAAAYQLYNDPSSLMKPGEAPPLWVNGWHETEAYLAELLMMNAVSEGRLLEEVRSGDVDASTYYALFGATSETDRSVIQSLVGFSRVLFAGGQVTNENVESLQRAVEEAYKSQGGTIVNWRTLSDLRDFLATQATRR